MDNEGMKKLLQSSLMALSILALTPSTSHTGTCSYNSCGDSVSCASPCTPGSQSTADAGECATLCSYGCIGPIYGSYIETRNCVYSR